MQEIGRQYTVETDDGPMELYEARPAEEARAAVVVLHEATGLDSHIRSVTRRFADEGFLAVSPDLYHRSGGGTASYDDFAGVEPLLEGLDDDAALVDVEACVAHLRGTGWRNWNVGLVGFCTGGRFSFLVAARRVLGAVVGFYGGGIVHPRSPRFPALVGEAGSLKSPWLGLFGDRDPHIPVEDVELLKMALHQSAVPTEVVRYAEAGHGFFCDGRPDHDATASEDAWRRTLDWLKQHIPPR